MSDTDGRFVCHNNGSLERYYYRTELRARNFSLSSELLITTGPAAADSMTVFMHCTVHKSYAHTKKTRHDAYTLRLLSSQMTKQGGLSYVYAHTHTHTQTHTLMVRLLYLHWLPLIGSLG